MGCSVWPHNQSCVPLCVYRACIDPKVVVITRESDQDYQDQAK